MRKRTHLLRLFLVLPWLICPAHAGVSIDVLSDCESRTGWGSAARLASGAKEGNFAIRWQPPNNRTGFLSLDFRSTGVDLASAYALAFWWKTEGSGLRDFKIKVRNHPLVGGMEAVYTIWDSRALPTDWRVAVVVLSEPQFDDWGGDPDLDRRYVTFRTVTDVDANVQIFIDRVVAVPTTFEWSVGDPRFDDSAGPDVDFDADGSVGFSDFILFAQHFGTSSDSGGFDSQFDLDGDGEVGFPDFITFSQSFGTTQGRWFVPVTLTNLTAEALTVTIGSGRTQLTEAALDPSGVAEVMSPITQGILTGRNPETTYALPLWAQVVDIEETRAAWTAYLPQVGPSRTWDQFVRSKTNGDEPILPDFSYAGYRYSEHPVPVAEGTAPLGARVSCSATSL